PLRGAIPAIFLGLALVLSATYLAYLHRSVASTPAPPPTGSPRASEIAHVNAFMVWVRAAGDQNRWALNASVIALGVALLFLPAPFITLDPQQTTTPHWPSPPTSVTTKTAPLQQTLYQAKVAEAASARASHPTDESKNGRWAWVILVAIGLLLV